MDADQPGKKYFFVSSTKTVEEALVSVDARIAQLNGFLSADPNNANIRSALANANLYKGVIFLKMAQKNYEQLLATDHDTLAKRYIARIETMLKEVLLV